MTHLLYRVEDFFSRLPLHWMWWPALGGLVVGLGGLIQPRALGVGYDVIGDLLQHHLLLSAALGLLLVKLVIWVDCAGFGNFRRRVGASADDRRGPGISDGRLAAGREPGAMGPGVHGRHSGGNHAGAFDRCRLCV